MKRGMKRGAIVLVGGQSRRMGRPKASLPFGDETLLERVLRVLAPSVCCRIVVAAPDQDLPPLPPGVIRANDLCEGRGPLEGLRAGLLAGTGHADAFYASSCDVPLLKTSFVDRMFASLRPDDQIVVPRDRDHFHPLAAVYRHDVLSTVDELLAEDRLRPFYLFDMVPTRVLCTDVLRAVDPELVSLRNVNTSEQYAAALRDAGLESKH